MELTAGFEPALPVPKTGVLPLDDTSKIGGHGRARTSDLLLNRELLYHSATRPDCILADQRGIEPRSCGRQPRIIAVIRLVHLVKQERLELSTSDLQSVVHACALQQIGVFGEFCDHDLQGFNLALYF